MKILRGKSLEEQMNHVDSILERFSKKMGVMTGKGIITPFPISGYAYVPIKDAVLRYMFPVDGTILVGAIYIEQMSKAGVEVHVTISLGDVHKSEQFFTDRNSMTIKPNISVVGGSRLTVYVKSKGGGEVFGIWVSFLWAPEVKDSIVKQFLIEELK